MGAEVKIVKTSCSKLVLNYLKFEATQFGGTQCYKICYQTPHYKIFIVKMSAFVILYESANIMLPIIPHGINWWKIRSSNLILNGCGSKNSNENKLFKTSPQLFEI